MEKLLLTITSDAAARDSTLVASLPSTRAGGKTSTGRTLLARSLASQRLARRSSSSTGSKHSKLALRMRAAASSTLRSKRVCSTTACCSTA